VSVRRFAQRFVTSAVDEHLRRRDPLTGLPNRGSFLAELDQLSAADATVALAVVDLDGFGAVNERFGHTRGDSVLREVANRLRRVAGPQAALGRLGADQFAAAFLADEQAAHALGADLLRAMRMRVADGDDVLLLTGSIGMAHGAGRSSRQLLADADMAMRAAKGAGRDRFVLLDEARRAASLDRRAMLAHVRGCLEHGTVHLRYQPIVDLVTREVRGCEALVRLPAPAGDGLLFPGAFLPLAEETGLDVDLGERVIDVALADLGRLLAAGPADPVVRMSINVTARQLTRPGFVAQVLAACEHHAVDPHRVQLELTETLVLADPDAAVTALGELRSHGISTALDDFGVGYSSMVNMKRLPVDELKIDRAFVTGLPDDSEAVAIVRLVLGLAEALGLAVSAEGIETDSQRATLVDLGCTTGQGYLFSPPRTVDELIPMLRR
jgi:diguanylate cyclase (GGDEF)-like protein